MKSLLWISLLMGFLLFAQGLPVDEKEVEEYQDDQDGESDDEDEAGPSPVLRSKDRSFSVTVGDSVVLPCQVDNPENGVIIWWSGTNILYTGLTATNLGKERSNIELLKDNSLSIRKILPVDLGQYRCEVIDSNQEKQFNVHYFVGTTAKPQITQVTPAHPKNIVQKGSSITLTCSATGSPAPKISFTKKTRHGTHEETFEGGVLNLENVTRKNSGVYQCRAENEHGVEWYKESTKLDNQHPDPQQNEKRKHSLKLHSIKATDFGIYKCAAKNSLGVTVKSIEVSGRPSKPIFQSVKSSSSDNKSPELKWKVESINPITDYELLYRVQDAGEWKTAYPQLQQDESPKGVYTVRHVLTDLQEAHTYQAQLKAKNSYGWSPLSDPHPFTGKSERKDQAASPTSAASELRISLALILSIIVARFYC
ncbi:hypothetical protein LSTR_LSTR012143 [Laodelphax striatellus]|uniref:Ig-like domain-containing protein n=1 Tax=Laodelphax striatellus TaxID=195883 RepID=A0A482XKJ4_LAOST|nr:hypothetical protein LSTR_LSTR012143 [Laodelphax striatellus]